MQIPRYVDRLGRNPFQKWFEELDGSTRARISATLDKLERGNFSTVKGVGAGVFEMRMDFGPGYRIYFGEDGERIVILLGGGTKKRQQNDIDNARELWREYKNQKREER
ncbi:MAG: type II toxin-antitoxin system RelE/ParE family toxin [Terracidiphilus sp.]